MAQIFEIGDSMPVSALTILIYSPPGAGKTTIASSLEKAILLDVDKGAHRTRYRTKTVQFDTWAELTGLVNDKRAMEGIKNVIIDTVGELLTLATRHIAENYPKNMDRASGTLAQRGWGMMGKMVNQLFDDVRYSGRNLILLAHEKEYMIEDVRRVRPDIQGQTFGAITKRADLIGYVSRQDGTQTMEFDPGQTFYAKNGADLQRQIVPSMDVSPKFLQGLVDIAKSSLGKSADEHKEIAQRVADLKERLMIEVGDGSEQSLANLNAIRADLLAEKPSEALKAQYAAALSAAAKRVNAIFDPTKKEYAPAQQ